MKPDRKILQEHNLAPHKRFGQNFLRNPHTAESIVNCGDISPEDTIIEVGVGLGALTNIIAARAKRVIGIEIDSGLIRYHHEQKILSDNVTLIHGDILKTDFNSLLSESNTPLKIMANLPYSISNPFIFKLIDHSRKIDWVVVMLQKEMAERLVAKPSTKQYGIPTVLLAAHAEVEKLMILKPNEFHPRPKIDSMVIRITFNKSYSGSYTTDESHQSLFHQVVRTSFAQRRKTLLNNLSSLPVFIQSGDDKNAIKDRIKKILDNAQIHPSARAENLDVQEYINITLSLISNLRGDTL